MKQEMDEVFKNINSRWIRINLKFIGFTMDDHHILKVQVFREAFSYRCD
ncbi:MAG: hypothetical protein GY765_27425 [bacterium]|nr:hypothetical protein [bacterium]